MAGNLSFRGIYRTKEIFRTHGWTGLLSCPLRPGAPQSSGEPGGAQVEEKDEDLGSQGSSRAWFGFHPVLPGGHM